MPQSKPEPGLYSFERLAGMDNLYAAAMKACKGKRFKEDVARFHHDLGRSLVGLRDELLGGKYAPGAYRTFEIWEPAHRFISAAPYRDRVVHHALCNIIQPLFEKSFILDSYANQKHKGTHRAVDRCTEYARRFRYVFQGDIRKFFPSIDHQILYARLARKVWDPRVLGLAKTILDHSNPQEPAEFYFPGDDLFTPFERRRGLPIGNLTSQFWANVYLDPFDHFMRDQIGVPGYIRYVDDFLVFGDDKTILALWREQAQDFLDGLRLLLNGRKSRIYQTREGIPFLGFRVFAWRRRLLAASVKRARRRLAGFTERYAAGRVGLDRVKASINAWLGHARHADTLGLRRRLLANAVFTKGAGGRPARGRVEQ